MDPEAPPQRRQSEMVGHRSWRARFAEQLGGRSEAIDQLERALELAIERQQELAVLVVNVDRLGSINDLFGTETGDQILVDIVTRMRAVVRATDVVAEVASGEFLVICDQPADVRAVARLARRMLRSLTGARAFGAAVVYASVSIGIAHANNGTRSADRLIADAETGMRHAKALGGARFHTLDHAERATRASAAATSADLGRAAQLDEFAAYFQPIVRLTDGELAGYEALVRWIHPVRGVVLPASFIDVAEQSGAIIEIGRRMLHLATQQYAGWARPQAQHGMHIGVNVSMRQLLDPGFVKRVTKTIKLRHLQPGELVIELTETTLTAERDQTLDAVRELRAAGAAVAIDDFGTGYSSLMRVGTLPIDYLKVDQSFVTTMLSDEVNRQLVKTTIDLAHALGAQAVAEGVETPEVARELQALGCDLGQGYLWSEPMPAARVPGWRNPARELLGLSRPSRVTTASH